MMRGLTLQVVRRLWRFFIICLGGLHTGVAVLQQSMGADGINYLEIGAAYWRGDWEMAINGIWSPLYGVIVGGVLTLASPDIHWVFPTVQIVNFFIFLASLACFEFFWREAWRSYSSRQHSRDGSSAPPWLWWSLGYALFLWASLNLIEIWAVTPDMLVSVTVYLSAGFMLRVVRDGGRWTSIGMGLALGVGYLAKAPMFPLSLACLALAALAIGDIRTAGRRLGPAFLAFLFIAGPFSITLSLREGHPTFSEVGRFTYLKHVNRIPFPQWREDEVNGLGVPLHPPLLVHTTPDVFQYPGPVRGSYPPSHDPDFFTEGLRPRVSMGEQLNATSFNLAFYFRLFFRTQGAMVGVALLMSLLFWRASRGNGLKGGEWYLALWSLACFAMYSLVFVTERYLGPFVVLFWAGFLSYWRLERTELAEGLSKVAGVIMILAILANVVALNLDGLVSIAGVPPPVEAPRTQFSDRPSASPPEVAEALAAAGVEAGTDIGLIGYGFTAIWAYLSEVRIVAEIIPEEAQEFWRGDEETRIAVLNAFRAAGALYLVAEETPSGLSTAGGWSPLGRTGYWLLDLAPD